MRHDLFQEGFGVRLRPAQIDDAAFIVGLRSDPVLGRFIHASSGSIPDQMQWMETYFERSGDYYFIIENALTGRPEGTVGIYDVSPDHSEAEWGRWILRPDSLAALGSVLLTFQIAFDSLALHSVRSLTITANSKVVSFHDRIGLEREGLHPLVLTQEEGPVDAMKHRLTRDAWQSLKTPLEAKAIRIEELLRRS